MRVNPLMAIGHREFFFLYKQIENSLFAFANCRIVLLTMMMMKTKQKNKIEIEKKDEINLGKWNQKNKKCDPKTNKQKHSILFFHNEKKRNGVGGNSFFSMKKKCFSETL